MTTLLALKNKKAELRNTIHAANMDGLLVDDEIQNEYETVIEQLSVAERNLLKPVDRCVRCRWLHE